MQTVRRAAKRTVLISPLGRFRKAPLGFSLLELIAVLIVMAAATAIILPSFQGGLKNLELETSGRDLVTLMKYARSQAITQQKVFRVFLFPKEGERAHYVFATAFGEQIKKQHLPEGISLSAEKGRFPVRIGFYPNGRSSGASFILTSSTGRQMRVAVDPITGLAKVVKGNHLER